MCAVCSWPTLHPSHTNSLHTGLQEVPVSSIKTDCRLKWTEAELAKRAEEADTFHARFADARFPSASTEARDRDTSRARRAYIYEKIQDALTKVENQVGVRGTPVFARLGYFKYVAGHTGYYPFPLKQYRLEKYLAV